MGSLPNLYQLSRDDLNNPIQRRPTPFEELRPIQLTDHPPLLMATDRLVRSNGHYYALSDIDTTFAHMTAYSPVSYHSVRTTALTCRRKESMASSAGASSVRRLIASVRTTPSRPMPPRRMVVKHCAALLLGHLIISAATLPIYPLQAGRGAFNPNLGPLLVAVLSATAAMTACFSTIIVQKLGMNLVIVLSHFLTTLFIGTHFFPKWYVLVPSYALLGIWIAPSSIARIDHVIVCANNLSIVCADSEDADENRRECLFRRINRGVKLAEDLGLALGCLIAGLVIKLIDQQPLNMHIGDVENICGAEYCPQDIYSHNNETLFLPAMPLSTVKIILNIFLGLAILAFGISLAFFDSKIEKSPPLDDQQNLKNFLKSIKISFQDPKLRLAAPMALFIGLEQGFIFGDFTEAYVVCALRDTKTVTLSFLSFALLQGIAGVTLSMFMKHIRRYFVVAAGLAFHACLLLALVTWKPAGDDPGLFNVISATWGVCNAVWETLILTLVLGLHPYNWQVPMSTSIFWKYLGLFLALGLHGLVCTRLRVWGLGFMLIVAVVPYTWLELHLVRRGKYLVSF